MLPPMLAAAYALRCLRHAAAASAAARRLFYAADVCRMPAAYLPRLLLRAMLLLR